MPLIGFQSLASLAAVEAHLWATGTFLYSALAVANHCGERWGRAAGWCRVNMWAELAGFLAAGLSLLPYYVSNRGLPSVGIAPNGAISRPLARRVGGGGLAAVVLWGIVRRLAAAGRPRADGLASQGETASDGQRPSADMRVKNSGGAELSSDMRVGDWLVMQGLEACSPVLSSLGYNKQIDMLMVRAVQASSCVASVCRCRIRILLCCAIRQLLFWMPFVCRKVSSTSRQIYCERCIAALRSRSL